MQGKKLKEFPPINEFIEEKSMADKVQNAITTGEISQRVRDTALRSAAIVKAKASILSWFTGDLEDYINSEADVDRKKSWSESDWPKIVQIVKNWYLEQVIYGEGQNLSITDIEDIKSELRKAHRTEEMLIMEWETLYKKHQEFLKDLAKTTKEPEEQEKSS